MTYAERSARLQKAAKARRAATARRQFNRANGGPIGAAFARVCAFLFTA